MAAGPIDSIRAELGSDGVSGAIDGDVCCCFHPDRTASIAWGAFASDKLLTETPSKSHTTRLLLPHVAKQIASLLVDRRGTIGWLRKRGRAVERFEVFSRYFKDTVPANRSQ